MEFGRFGPLRKGWRFSPTDEELINDFLKQKNDGQLPHIDEIPDVDVCKFEPWDLPNKSLINSDDLEWFFFSPCERKYPRGCRKNRMTKVGYWKATGKDRNIKSRSKLIGKKRTLVFYQGHAPNGARTNWIMHEYQTAENGVDCREAEGAYVLCRLKKKVDEDANSNFDYVVTNDITPTTTMPMPFPDDTHVGDAVELFETPLNQGIPVTSARQAERLEAGEADNGMLYPLILEEGHCISQMAEAKLTDGIDSHQAEAKLTEVQSLLRSFESLDNPQCLSPLDDNVYIGQGHPCRDLPLNENCGMVQQMEVEQDCLDEVNNFLIQSDKVSRVSILNDGHDEDAFLHVNSIYSTERRTDDEGSNLQINSLSIESELTDDEPDEDLLASLYAKPSICVIQACPSYVVTDRGSGRDAYSKVSVSQVRGELEAYHQHSSSSSSTSSSSSSSPEPYHQYYNKKFPYVGSKNFGQMQAATRPCKITPPDGPHKKGNRGLLHCSNLGPDVFTVNSSADSFHDLFNNLRESPRQKDLANSRDCLDGTGIKIRARLQHQQANSPKCVAQGIAPRRIHLLRKIRGQLVFGNGSGSNSDAEARDLKSVITEVGSSKDTGFLGGGPLDVSYTNSSDNFFINPKSSSQESSTNRSNVSDGTRIKTRVHQPEFVTNACRVASQPKGTASTKILLQKKSSGQSVSWKRDLSRDAKGHEAKAVISVGRENDKPAITGVNRQLGTSELEALLIHELNLLHLANQSQNKAPLNMEGNKVDDANSTARSQSKWRIDARKSKGLVIEEETKHETKTVRGPQRLKLKNGIAPLQ